MNKPSAAFEPVLSMLEEYKAYGQCIAILNEMVPQGGQGWVSMLGSHRNRGVSVVRDDLQALRSIAAREIKVEVKHLVMRKSTNKECLTVLFRNPDFHTFALETDDGR
jgi:hypothetical protein